MENKKNSKTIFSILEKIILGWFLIALIGCFIIQLVSPTIPFAVWTKENVWDIHKTFISLKSHVPTLIESLIYIVIVYAVCRVIRLLFSARMKKSYRAKTTLSLLDGMVKYACAITIIILILKVTKLRSRNLIHTFLSIYLSW